MMIRCQIHNVTWDEAIVSECPVCRDSAGQAFMMARDLQIKVDPVLRARMSMAPLLVVQEGTGTASKSYLATCMRDVEDCFGKDSVAAQIAYQVFFNGVELLQVLLIGGDITNLASGLYLPYYTGEDLEASAKRRRSLERGT